MLSKDELLSIREHLDLAQNPVFFYDNDVDGLCSYILLRRYLGSGKGVAVKSHPEIDKNYARKAQELNADYVFVLDRPHLGKEFVEEIASLHLPIVWIDHHEVSDIYDYSNLFYFNPQKSKDKSSEPTTFLCYSATKREEDMWIAMMGCLADNYLPTFLDDFSDKYPEYWGKNIYKPFDAFYGAPIGRLSRALSFGIKDSITHVVQLQNFLINCKNPSEMSLELEATRSFGKKYREIISKYNLLLERAKSFEEEKILFYNYGGDLSISSDLSNELCYLYPDKYVVVAYSSGPFTNISLRGKEVRNIFEKIIGNFEDSSGGGHLGAVGCRIKTEDVSRFKQEILKEL